MAPELPNLTTLAPAGAGFVSTVSAPPSVLSVVCAEACSDVVVCAVDDPQPANVPTAMAAVRTSAIFFFINFPP